ncbi:MAG: FGGY family carbohydrate kinase [Caldilineaceae bacterium]
MTDLLLGVDLGTSSVKAVVTDLQGTTIAAAAEAYSVQQPRPGYAEQDPAAWWDALCRTVRRVTSQCDAAAIRAVGLSGQMHGTVLLDAELNVLGPAVIWQDQRSAAQVAEIEARVGRERLLAIAGSPVATGFMAATVRWLQVHEPDVWARSPSAPAQRLPPSAHDRHVGRRPQRRQRRAPPGRTRAPGRRSCWPHLTWRRICCRRCIRPTRSAAR